MKKVVSTILIFFFSVLFLLKTQPALKSWRKKNLKSTTVSAVQNMEQIILFLK